MRAERQFLIYASADLLGKSIGLITSPLMTKLLTPAQFGASALLTTVWGLFYWLQYSGMDSSFPAFRANEKDEDARIEITVTASVIALVSSILVWIPSAIIALSQPWLLDYTGVSRFELFLFILGMAPSGYLGWNIIFFRFTHRPRSFAQVSLASRVLGPVLAIPLIWHMPQEKRLGIFLMAVCGANAIATVLSVVEFKRLTCSPYTRNGFSWPLAKKMLHYGVPIIPGAILCSFLYVLDRLLLGFYSGTTEVAIYSLAISLGAVALSLKTWFGLVYHPHMVEWKARLEHHEFESKLEKVAQVLSIIFFSLVLFSLFWSRPFVQFFYPASYLPAAQIVPVLVAVCAFSILAIIAGVTTTITMRPKYHVYVSILGFAANFFSCMILIPQYHAFGAALALLITEVVMLMAWVIIGRFILRNFLISWVLPLMVAFFTVSLAYFYTSGVLWANHPLGEASVLSGLLAILVGVSIYFLRPANGWKALLS